MKIIEAITQIDNLKHNTYSQNDKVQWLSRLDSNVKRLVIDTHEGGEEVRFSGYTAETDPNTVMLVEEPFDEVYLRYLEMQIDYANGEIEKYNNSAMLYNEAWLAFQNYYNRTHMPKGQKMKFF